MGITAGVLSPIAGIWSKIWVEEDCMGPDIGLANGRSGAECDEEASISDPVQHMTFLFNRAKYMFPLFYRSIGVWLTIDNYLGGKSMKDWVGRVPLEVEWFMGDDGRWVRLNMSGSQGLTNKIYTHRICRISSLFSSGGVKSFRLSPSGLRFFIH